MKLRNKKTGEIMQLSVKCENGGELKTFDLNTNTDKSITLAELNEGWEDYEEPKNGIEGIRLNDVIAGRHIVEIDFTEVKQAEKAVDKLKAYKRLKEEGFEFVRLRAPSYSSPDIVTIKARCNWTSESINDLDFLFGGEE